MHKAHAGKKKVRGHCAKPSAEHGLRALPAGQRAGTAAKSSAFEQPELGIAMLTYITL